ncbi:MAG: hypothetical protein KDA65_00975 [Planctomycetaceae bacterium]|nr:hypothetical protein [Planctomycetaceae bacterium]
MNVVQRTNELYRNGTLTQTEAGLSIIKAAIEGESLAGVEELDADLWKEVTETLKENRDQLRYAYISTQTTSIDKKDLNESEVIIFNRDQLEIARERLGIKVENPNLET